MLSVSLYLRKITKSLRISRTLTKLFHIKRHHPVHFYISPKKREKSHYLCNGMIDLHNIWRAGADRTCFWSARLLKIPVSKIQHRKRSMCLRDPFFSIVRCRNFSISKMAAGYLQQKILTTIYCRDMFYISCQIMWRSHILLQKYRDFSCFLVNVWA